MSKSLPIPGIQTGGIQPEQHFILRAPPSISAALKEKIRNRTMEESFSVSINCINLLIIPLSFNVIIIYFIFFFFMISIADNRTANVKFEDRELKAKLFDLPCIIESHKTFDSKQFYKIADICQVSSFI